MQRCMLHRVPVLLLGMLVATLLPTVASARPEVATATAKQTTLQVGIRQVGEVFDPTSQLPAEISAVAANVIEWLFDSSYNGKPKLGLVAWYRVTPDGKTIDMLLRKGVTFHSGDPFTAEDVIFSWNRLKQNGFSDRVARTLQRFEVVDPHHIRIHFGAPELGFVPQLGFPIVSKAYYDRVGEERFRKSPVGTGPYKFHRIKRGEYVELVRYDNYWGRKPEVQKVRMRFMVEDTTRLAALKKGELDIAMQVPFQSVEDISRTKGLKTTRLSPGGFTVYLAPKYLKPETPWAKREVREAIALAIDRAAIVDKLLKGVPDRFAFLAPSDLGYDPNLKPYPYNPTRARQLLQQAGYGGGFTIDLPYIAGAQTGVKETAEAIALYLSRVGIRATPKALEGPRFIEFVLKASRDPAQDYLALFIGAVSGKPEPTTALVTTFSAVTPFAWYRNAAVNALVLRAAGTVDRQARAALIKQIQNMIYADYGFMPIWNGVSVFGMKSCISFRPKRGDLDYMLIRDVSVKRCRR